MQSPLVAGARRALTMAFSAVVARRVVAGLLGFVAGLSAGSRLDRAIMGLAETMAPLPALLLAMLVLDYVRNVAQHDSTLLTMSRQLPSGGHYELFGSSPRTVSALRPTLLVSYRLVSRLLAASGRSLDEMVRMIPRSASEPAVY